MAPIWQKAMYIVPCYFGNHPIWMRNRILTELRPLGSGSGPIGALLMGSRMNNTMDEFLLDQRTLLGQYINYLYSP